MSRMVGTQLHDAGLSLKIWAMRYTTQTNVQSGATKVIRLCMHEEVDIQTKIQT